MRYEVSLHEIRVYLGNPPFYLTVRSHEQQVAHHSAFSTWSLDALVAQLIAPCSQTIVRPSLVTGAPALLRVCSTSVQSVPASVQAALASSLGCRICF